MSTAIENLNARIAECDIEIVRFKQFAERYKDNVDCFDIVRYIDEHVFWWMEQRLASKLRLLVLQESTPDDICEGCGILDRVIEYGTHKYCGACLDVAHE